MSGGFFRGTSADQDTRFSNKQAKLLKSQKFAPELEHLVDISKVKMDVVKPWIATRVTELLGFEDEVLINFIYGLLDGKVVNGKEIQIQITGFMEKNTGKFMKELWSLLVSAQNNASGVPQQFLDAKEEEIRKKKVESDRITHEIQKKKELEQEKFKKMDSEVDVSRDADDASNRSSKHLLPRASSAIPEEEKESDARNGVRSRSRISRSPHLAQHSPLPERTTRSRSISKSLSNSRSHSDGRARSASMSRSPLSRGRSMSPEKCYRSPRKRSLTPRSRNSPRRARSPIRRRSPHSRRRSSSDSWGRSPSPRRRRLPTPVRRKSPSLRRRRSPSPVRRRSPSPRRRRSPSPLRRRSPPPRRRRSPSPMRRRSPSPVRRRSPPLVRRRSPPLYRGSPSPMRRRSPIPLRKRSHTPSWQRSPSPPRRRSPSPVRRRSPPSRRRSPSPPRRRSPSPVRRRSPPPRSPKKRRRSPLRSPRQRNRSTSPYRSRSPAYHSRRNLSRDDDLISNGIGSKGYRDKNASQRIRGERSPVREVPEREGVDRFGQGRKGSEPVARQPAISMRSPQREPMDRIDTRKRMHVSSPSAEKSPVRSDSSPFAGKSSPSEDRRTLSLSESPGRKARADSASPVRQGRDRVTRNDSPETDIEEGTRYARGDGGRRIDSPGRRIRHSPKVGSQRDVPIKEPHHREYSPGVTRYRSGEAQRRVDDIEINRNDRDKKSHKASVRIDHPGTPQQSPRVMEEGKFGPGRIEGARLSSDYFSDERPSVRQSKSPSAKKQHKAHSKEDSDKNVKNKSEDMEKRKHRRSEKHEMPSDDASSDSYMDERKEAKRRKKEEKKLRKEERRRRRHERHRRREERRAGKLKAKPMDTVTPPSDIEKNRNDTDDSDGPIAARRDSHPSDTEETESEQKKLEIELRKKALESLRAKKATIP